MLVLVACTLCMGAWQATAHAAAQPSIYAARHCFLISPCLFGLVCCVWRRRAQGYDSGLLDTVKDKVTLYSTSVGDAMPFTTLEAAIGQNQILRESRLGSQLTVWVGSRAGEGVRVHLCRPESATEMDCGDGKDNDCDGYTDSEDTDCKSGPSTARRLLLEQLETQTVVFSAPPARLGPSLVG